MDIFSIFISEHHTCHILLEKYMHLLVSGSKFRFPKSKQQPLRILECIVIFIGHQILRTKPSIILNICSVSSVANSTETFLNLIHILIIFRYSRDKLRRGVAGVNLNKGINLK
jgi:hypothetical protein